MGANDLAGNEFKSRGDAAFQSLTAAAGDRQSAAGEYLTFNLGEEQYGVEILQVQEIRNFEQPTKIVSAPDHVLGVIHLRGVIVPIVDLRMRLGVSEATFGQLTVVVILNLRGRVVGVVVDSVSEVLEIQEGQVHPASEWRGGADIGYVKGLGCVRQNDAERMVILLDIEGLLGSTAFAAN